MNEAKNDGPTHDEIEKRAYELFLERGVDSNAPEDGHALKDWLIAETELEQEYARRRHKQAKSRATSGN
jgi:hypothetical protein